MQTWPLQEVRNHLRTVIDRALDQGPQRITRHGKQAVIVVICANRGLDALNGTDLRGGSRHPAS